MQRRRGGTTLALRAREVVTCTCGTRSWRCSAMARPRYQLLKLFNQRIGPFWHPNIGQIYQLLHELERRGLGHPQGSGGAVRACGASSGSRGAESARCAPGSLGVPPARLRCATRSSSVCSPPSATAPGAREPARPPGNGISEIRRAPRGRGRSPERSVTRRLAHEAALGQAEAHLRWLARCRAVLDPLERAS
jgi:hypothetical protein